MVDLWIIMLSNDSLVQECNTVDLYLAKHHLYKHPLQITFQPNTLRDHIAEQHSEVKSFFCFKCGKGYALKHKLNAHIRDIHGEKTHICETCGKGEWSGSRKGGGLAKEFIYNLIFRAF